MIGATQQNKQPSQDAGFLTGPASTGLTGWLLVVGGLVLLALFHLANLDALIVPGVIVINGMILVCCFGLRRVNPSQTVVPQIHITQRGGAPAWRQAFILLGFENADPELDGRHSFRVSNQINKRTPKQLMALLDSLSVSLEQFQPLISKAVAYRAEQKQPEGEDALGLVELGRFLRVVEDALAATLTRKAHQLDENREVQALYEAASVVSTQLTEKAGRLGLLNSLEIHPGLWSEMPESVASTTSGAHP